MEKFTINYNETPSNESDVMTYVFIGMIAIIMKQSNISTIKLDNRSISFIDEIEISIDDHIMQITPKFKECM